MSPDSITRKEIDESRRSDLCDEFLLDLTSRMFGVSTYQVIFAALLVTRGNAHGNHIERIYQEFWHTGRVPNEVRQYAKDCLVGRKAMIVDEGYKEGILLA